MQLADAQDVAPKAGGRVSYEQPADQGGVLTRQDGPPYRDAGDAVRARPPAPLARAARARSRHILTALHILPAAISDPAPRCSQKVALLWVVIVTFALALFCVCYCICSHGNGSCKWCRETVEGPVAAVLCGSGCIVCTIIYFIWVFLS